MRFFCSLLAKTIIFISFMVQIAIAKVGIRDAEIEETLELYSKPIFKAANLENQIELHILPSKDINAFVAGGKNIFLYSGLIIKTDSPNELQAVIAHEMGHIIGGHIVRTYQAQENAFIRSILTTALVGAASVLAQGDGDAVAGSLLAGQQAGMSDFLNYSRTQEASADQSGFQLLERASISPKGMLNILNKLAEMERYSRLGTKSYAGSHPLSQERIDLVKQAVETSKIAETSYDKERFDRMKAKLIGFLDDPDAVLRQYPNTDTSVGAYYARAVAYHRISDLKNAIAQMDYLLQQKPNDVYYNELKGQIYFEQGKIIESVEAYKKAFSLKSSPLIAVSYAQSLVEAGDNNSLLQAERLLRNALVIEKDFSTGWHLLSVAFDRLQKPGYAAWASAENFLSQNNYLSANQQAKKSIEQLPNGSIEWYRAKDIVHLSQRQIRDMCKANGRDINENGVCNE